MGDIIHKIRADNSSGAYRLKCGFGPGRYLCWEQVCCNSDLCQHCETYPNCGAYTKIWTCSCVKITLQIALQAGKQIDVVFDAHGRCPGVWPPDCPNSCGAASLIFQADTQTLAGVPSKITVFDNFGTEYCLYASVGVSGPSNKGCAAPLGSGACNPWLRVFKVELYQPKAGEDTPFCDCPEDTLLGSAIALESNKAWACAFSMAGISGELEDPVRITKFEVELGPCSVGSSGSPEPTCCVCEHKYACFYEWKAVWDCAATPPAWSAVEEVVASRLCGIHDTDAGWVLQTPVGATTCEYRKWTCENTLCTILGDCPTPSVTPDLPYAGGVPPDCPCTPTVKKCLYTWETYWDCDLGIYLLNSTPIASECLEESACSSAVHGWEFDESRLCYYLQTTCEYTCTTTGECDPHDPVPTPPADEPYGGAAPPDDECPCGPACDCVHWQEYSAADCPDGFESFDHWGCVDHGSVEVDDCVNTGPFTSEKVIEVNPGDCDGDPCDEEECDPCVGHDTCADCSETYIVTLSGYTPGHWPTGDCARLNGVWEVTLNTPFPPYPCGWKFQDVVDGHMIVVVLFCNGTKWTVWAHDDGIGDYPAFSSDQPCICNTGVEHGCPNLGVYTLDGGMGGCAHIGTVVCTVSLP